MGRKKNKKLKLTPLNQVILTATLSGIISILGFYITSNLQAKTQLIQTRFELKATAYNTFLNSINLNPINNKRIFSVFKGSVKQIKPVGVFIFKYLTFKHIHS